MNPSAGSWSGTSGGAGSCSQHTHSTRKKSRSSGGSKTSSLKMSYTESLELSGTVKSGPSSVDNSFLNGLSSSSTDVDKEIAAKAVALVVNHTRRGKTGLVSLCSLVGNILQAKLSLKQVVSSQNREIAQLRSILCHLRVHHQCNFSGSSGSSGPAFGMTTVGTHIKGDPTRLTVERSTCTSHLAEKPVKITVSCETNSSGAETDSFGSALPHPLLEKFVQVDASSQADFSGEETDSFGSASSHPLIEKPVQVDASSQADFSGEETDSFGSAHPPVQKPEKIDVSSQTNSSGEETDNSSCRLVFKDCQSICTGCQTDESSSGCMYLNSPEREDSSQSSGSGNSIEKQLERCHHVLQPLGMVNESLEQQLKTAAEKIVLLEKQISVLKTELWVLRRKVLPPQQLAAEQHKMPQPPSSNLCHPQQIEEKEIDVETSSFTLLSNRGPMSPRQMSTESSELPQLNMRMEMDQIITYNQINTAKHKERKGSVLRSKKIHPAFPHRPITETHTKKPCPSGGLLECRCSGCEDTDSPNRQFKPNQNKKSHSRSRPKVYPNEGDRVVIEGEISGVVKYLGPIDNSQVTYVGLHLDSPVGKGTGTVRGKKFFECPRNYCKFVPVREVLCVVSEGKPVRSNSSSSFAVASRRCAKLTQRTSTRE